METYGNWDRVTSLKLILKITLVYLFFPINVSDHNHINEVNKKMFIFIYMAQCTLPLLSSLDGFCKSYLKRAWTTRTPIINYV